MDKLSLKKNRLDIEYKFESQKAILFLTFGTITMLGFITGLIIQKYYMLAGISAFIISGISYYFYAKKQKKLNEILNNIEKLE